MGALLDLWQRRLGKVDREMVDMIVLKRISRSRLLFMKEELKAIAEDIDKALCDQSNTP